ncbi:MAG: DciA family protein [Synechococcus sp.]|nr:DciA family protein [Synechococcus sp.]
MGLQSVDHLLRHLLNQPAWAHQKRFTQVTQCWQKISSPKIRANSDPLQIIDDVLWIATSSHTWSQHLSLQRQRFLFQLNADLNPPLKDLRFSTVHWHRKPAYSPLAADPNLPHPSTIPITPQPPVISPKKPQDPITAVQRWAATQQKRFANLPACPCCHRPTPPGEIERWQMCSICIVREWQQEQADFCLGLPPEAIAPDPLPEPEIPPEV